MSLGSRWIVLALALLTLPLVAARCDERRGTSPDPLYPFVLVHGLFGTQTYTGGLDYWYRIPEAMEDEGARVFIAQLSAVGGSTVRGEQLVAQVEDVLALTGAAKVHLIGHSQGGLDCRFAAGVRPDLVASVTTVGTPNKGAELPGLLARGILDDGSFSSALVDLFGASLVPLVELIGGSADPLEVRAAAELLAPETVAAFNEQFPRGLPIGCHDGDAEVDGVRYYSWTGSSTVTNPLDITDALQAVAGLVHLGVPSDGQVTVCSAQFGHVIADDLRMNHFDQVNQVLGLTSLFEVDPRTLFRDHVRRLAELGL